VEVTKIRIAVRVQSRDPPLRNRDAVHLTATFNSFGEEGSFFSEPLINCIGEILHI
jgi:hypothetical protein